MTPRKNFRVNFWVLFMALCTTIVFTAVTHIFSQTCTATSSGSWSAGSAASRATWSCTGGATSPNNASEVIIPSGLTVTISNDQTWNADVIVDGGTIVFGNKLTLGTTSGCGFSLIMINDGRIDDSSSPGANERLIICGTTVVTSQGNPTPPAVSWPAGGFSNTGFNENGEIPVLLPVNLLSFGGSQIENSIHLSWQTATELNNDYFTVERSQNGIHYEVIGEVQGYGTTNEQQDYQFIDNSPLQGLSYYRLRQTDFDGTIEIFRAVSVVLKSLASASASVFPNPFSQSDLTVSLRGFAALSDVQLDILNVNGVPVYSTVVNAGSSSAQAATLRLDFLPKGYYVVRLSGNDINTHLKLIRE